MTDTRTNEQIARDALREWESFAPLTVGSPATAIVAALAAVGRLVTPEHDAQVWDAGRIAGGQHALAITAEARSGEKAERPVNPYA